METEECGRDHASEPGGRCPFHSHDTLSSSEFANAKAAVAAINEVYEERYRDCNERLHSFQNWPNSQNQNPWQLAHSGFYYTGADDCVSCFCCGISVYKWKPDEVPLKEHAKQNPECAYIRRLKRASFVDRIAHDVLFSLHKGHPSSLSSLHNSDESDNLVQTFRSFDVLCRRRPLQKRQAEGAGTGCTDVCEERYYDSVNSIPLVQTFRSFDVLCRRRPLQFPLDEGHPSSRSSLHNSDESDNLMLQRPRLRLAEPFFRGNGPYCAPEPAVISVLSDSDESVKGTRWFHDRQNKELPGVYSDVRYQDQCESDITVNSDEMDLGFTGRIHFLYSRFHNFSSHIFLSTLTVHNEGGQREHRQEARDQTFLRHSHSKMVLFRSVSLISTFLLLSSSFGTALAEQPNEGSYLWICENTVLEGTPCYTFKRKSLSITIMGFAVASDLFAMCKELSKLHHYDNETVGDWNGHSGNRTNEKENQEDRRTNAEIWIDLKSIAKIIVITVLFPLTLLYMFMSKVRIHPLNIGKQTLLVFNSSQGFSDVIDRGRERGGKEIACYPCNLAGLQGKEDSTLCQKDGKLLTEEDLAVYVDFLIGIGGDDVFDDSEHQTQRYSYKEEADFVKSTERQPSSQLEMHINVDDWYIGDFGQKHLRISKLIIISPKERTINDIIFPVQRASDHFKRLDEFHHALSDKMRSVFGTSSFRRSLDAEYFLQNYQNCKLRAVEPPDLNYEKIMEILNQKWYPTEADIVSIVQKKKEENYFESQEDYKMATAYFEREKRIIKNEKQFHEFELRRERETSMDLSVPREQPRECMLAVPEKAFLRSELEERNTAADGSETEGHIYHLKPDFNDVDDTDKNKSDAEHALSDAGNQTAPLQVRGHTHCLLPSESREMPHQAAPVNIEEIDRKIELNRPRRVNFGKKKHVIRDVTWLPLDQLPDPDLDAFVVAHNPNADIVMALEQIYVEIGQRKVPGPRITMRYEILRLCTMKTFPRENKPYVIRLAAAGFYFASEADEVTCYSCGIRRRGWEEKENPIAIHQRISPRCSFLTSNAEVNVPIPEPTGEPSERLKKLLCLERGEQTYAESSSNSSQLAVTANTQLQVIIDSARRNLERERANATRRAPGSGALQRDEAPSGEQPKHPEYVVRSVRLQSFTGWPRDLVQTPDIMSEAGFYYAGFGDCVRCFHCGIGLRHWTEDDNPWVEHCRWSSSCQYLRKMKGNEFVRLVQMAVRISEEEPETLISQQLNGRSTLVVANNTPETSGGASSSDPSPEMDSSKILLTDAAQSVLEMGYQPKTIKQAIDSILKTRGPNAISAVNIMEVVLEMEEKESEDKASTNSTASSLGSSDKDKKTEMIPDVKEKQEKEGETGKKEGVHHSADLKIDSKSIKSENERLKEQTLCKVCLTAPISIVFLPCGHLVTCTECAPAMRKCPICRQLVKGTVRTYMG